MQLDYALRHFTRPTLPGSEMLIHSIASIDIRGYAVGGAWAIQRHVLRCRAAEAKEHIRIALGANKSALYRLIFRDSAKLLVIGLVSGSLALSQ